MWGHLETNYCLWGYFAAVVAHISHGVSNLKSIECDSLHVLQQPNKRIRCILRITVKFYYTCSVYFVWFHLLGWTIKHSNLYTSTPRGSPYYINDHNSNTMEVFTDVQKLKMNLTLTKSPDTGLSELNNTVLSTTRNTAAAVNIWIPCDSCVC